MGGMARPKGPDRRAVNYRLPPALLDALDKLIEQTRRTATAEVEIALEAHLKAAGLWPPPETTSTEKRKKK